ncbi:hypothetical protein WKW80_00965 [Variovorax humicola]|uniref:Uncharacterized protein n=1 Tax=Variovorax humicola TaxID=1769758 RepID=A0ABU8VSA3_9BURK
MFVYDRDTLLATLEPVPLSKSGTEIHIEAFNPTRLVRQDYRHVGRLIFLEICVFISEKFPQIQAINFALSRRVDVLGAGEQQASERAETMDRIGAINVRMRPKPNALPGHFVVSGVWAYSEQNFAALMQVLEEERAQYRRRPIGSSAPEKSKVLSTIRQWVTGRATVKGS